MYRRKHLLHFFNKRVDSGNKCAELSDKRAQKKTPPQGGASPISDFGLLNIKRQCDATRLLRICEADTMFGNLPGFLNVDL